MLAVGDVVGSPGRETLKRCLPLLRDQYRIDVCIANGENAAAGFGMTASTAEEMFDAGVDVITGGNHTFDKREFTPYLESSERVIRPANYSPGIPGRGYATIEVNGTTVAIVNLMGRTFMPPVDDPFRCAEACLEALRGQTPVILVDMHAEATSEKVAMGRYLDGRVSLVFGTHTHVQTADEQILSKGTAYISDLGMTGPSDGIIGMEQQTVLDRFLFGISDRFSVEKRGPRQFCGLFASIDAQSGKAVDVKRLFLKDVA